jgi:hypothetical protein
MDWACLGVHDGVVAGGNTRDFVHGVPLAACWRWIKDVSVATHII